MKLTTCTLALAIGTAFSCSSLAADVVVYGKANLSLQSNNEGAGTYTEIKSNASRIGFKGTHDLGNDVEVVYQAEFEVDLDGDSDDNVKNRNQYIGLKGRFGTLLLGNNDTMLKQSQGKIDLFNDLNADIKHLFKGENRMSSTVTYMSPKIFEQLQLGMTYIAGEGVEVDDSVSVAAFYGDKSLKNSAVYASIAMDSDVKGYDITRFTVSSKISDIILAALYQHQESNTGSEMDGYVVSAKYSINDFDLKAQYQIADHTGGDTDKGYSVGADYKLAKSTKLYTFYTTMKLENSTDKDYLAVGIEYNF